MAFAALTTGVSGVSAFSEGVNIVSDNIANVNSVGYKRSEGTFASLINDGTRTTSYNPGGVSISARRYVDQQGLPEPTQRSTDVAIRGSGFFVVRDNIATDNSSIEFTRAGNFVPDVNGNLVNTSGKTLLGIPLDADGNLTASPTDTNSYQPINTQAIAGTADPTQTSTLFGNLPANPTGGSLAAAIGQIADGTVTAQETTTVSIFDGQGNQTLVDVGFVQTGADEYRIEAVAQDPSLLDATAHPNGLLFSATARFNADGTLQELVTDSVAAGGAQTTPGTTVNTPGDLASIGVDVTYAASGNTQTVDFGVGTIASPDGLNQNDALFSVLDNTDGAVFGEVIGVDIREDGTVTANFDNGVSRDIFQVPLATFNNPNGLTADDGGVFRQNAESGNAQFSIAGRGGSGTLKSGAVEKSTVDLAQEFSDLIVNQRGFSANARVISTSDEILQELTNII
ncbi:flagellar hook protein FlgE [Rhodothalassium salexigens DSM 2132]|uniref:Flagellar hook protein FlgE n=1 Tax=Rhodothalassium salexigens DSM 2132 TaxID=1188247 RepID=A0A4R2PGE3_RHOSA|nr:flagellar hook protein FlgE [Rhodothalassium salexigens]MBB4211635.1 flagellar hook protein FlgE [Rhodothalassium salexigens DSM 2132]MBK1639099.1 hypothetical protein [Rhodothalassium salexigens DSM 2132]TCP34433.1 flagellar hook protein FlgE [Rhodothalassium salexigens DSM 2132]